MKRLTKYLFGLFLSLAIATGSPVLAQNVPDQVATALKRGDASSVSRHFGDLVDITINKKQNNYSPAHAEMVLRDWFSKNDPSKYEAEHSGTSSGNSVFFSIGQLTTSTGKYRVYMLFKQRDNALQLSEIRFEKL